VLERVPLEVGAHPERERYMATKAARMRHMFGTTARSR
jgi:GTP cyclohydrolase II